MTWTWQQYIFPDQIGSNLYPHLLGKASPDHLLMVTDGQRTICSETTQQERFVYKNRSAGWYGCLKLSERTFRLIAFTYHFLTNRTLISYTCIDFRTILGSLLADMQNMDCGWVDISFQLYHPNNPHGCPLPQSRFY